MTRTWKIERLGAQGDGEAEGLFAPFTLPGETVTGRPEDGRLVDVRISDPVGDRVAAPCPHFRQCGGCALQHASDPFVTAWKQEQIATALARAGLVADFRTPHVSPPGSRRRATFAARRTKKAVQIGFHRRASDQIIDLRACPVLDPALFNALGDLGTLAQHLASRKDALRIHVTTTLTGLDVDVHMERPPDPADVASLASLMPQTGWARLALNGEVQAQSAAPMVAFDGIRVDLPRGAFLQATRAGEEALGSAVREIIGDARSVADLFAGCGTFALPLSRHARVGAFESGSEQTAALSAAWRRAEGLKPLEARRRDLFRAPLAARELNGFDSVVIDPPRAGARAQAETLAQSKVETIAFVSCNPATFARDARILVDGGYRMDWIKCIDQFRWSPHVELVARFERG